MMKPSMHLIFDSSRKNISDHDFQHITPNLAITRSLKLPIATRRFKIPTAALERPANKLDIKFHTGLDLFGVSLELIYIPIRPQKFALQEARFRACKPDMEGRGQRNYIKVSIVTSYPAESHFTYRYLPCREQRRLLLLCSYPCPLHQAGHGKRLVPDLQTPEYPIADIQPTWQRCRKQIQEQS